MLKFGHLLTDPLGDLRMGMPVQVHPPGADPIEQCPACFCEKSATFGSNNGQRRLRRLHLRIGMPKNRLISFRPAHVSSEWLGEAWHISELFQGSTATPTERSEVMDTQCVAK